MKFKTKEDMHKLLIILLVLLLIVILLYGVIVYTKTNILPKQIIITSIDSDYKDKKLNIKIKVRDTIAKGNVYCAIVENESDKKEYKKAHKNTCTYKLDLKEHYIYIKNDNGDKQEYKLTNLISRIIEINSKVDKIFLATNDTYKLNIEATTIKNTDFTVAYKVEDENIATITDDGTIKAINNGDTNIIVSYNNKNIKIPLTVSSLITYPHIDNTRPMLACKNYSNDEAKLLDTILEEKVKMYGYKTRAGVVEAARFLSLEFPYRINYFLENGRTTSNVIAFRADGEGRYYRRGLYLSEDKYDSLSYKLTGPSMWGCPLYNLNFNQYRPNGLDCSGFVSWAIVNGGIDIGDLGSMGYVIDGTPDLTTSGEVKRITKELLTSGAVKAGDLASVAGHVAIIIGIDDNHVYIAEELFYNKGVQVLTFTYDELVATNYFTDIVLMDKVYKEDGNYSAMW